MTIIPHLHETLAMWTIGYIAFVLLIAPKIAAVSK